MAKLAESARLELAQQLEEASSPVLSYGLVLMLL